MKNWKLLEVVDEEIIKNFSEHSRVVLQLLFNRGFKTKEDIGNFLQPDFNNIHDPFLFQDMEAAVNLLIDYIKTQQPITIYGDYDADGVTSSAILFEIISLFKGVVDIYIPNRVTEGYGMNKKAIDEIAGKGTKLIITVDNGIKDKEMVAYAKSKGVTVIITDHHLPPERIEDLPEALIIDAHLASDNYPFKFLAGAGVAFKLAQALIEKSKLKNEDKQTLEKSLMDLVAVGTVADSVSLLGENRLLLIKGLESLNNTKRKGLKELIEISKINGQKINSWNIGFQIGPRLNAAGRLDHANTAFKLLVTRDSDEAKEIALTLNSQNIERQKITESIMNALEEQVKAESDDKVIIGVCPPVLESEAWNEGVIGLVAGKICEKYYKPTLVITRVEDGFKGSGRSIEGLNIVEAVASAKEFLHRYGGHAAACGFSLGHDDFDNFSKQVTKYVNEKLKDVALIPAIRIDTELNLQEINFGLIDELNKFEPFGSDNDKPKFVSYRVSVIDKIFMGQDGQHLKLRLKQNESDIFNAVGFGQTEKWEDISIGQEIDIVYYLDINQFNGREDIQMKIIDIKSVS